MSVKPKSFFAALDGTNTCRVILLKGSMTFEVLFRNNAMLRGVAMEADEGFRWARSSSHMVDRVRVRFRPVDLL